MFQMTASRLDYATYRKQTENIRSTGDSHANHFIQSEISRNTGEMAQVEVHGQSLRPNSNVLEDERRVKTYPK